MLGTICHKRNLTGGLGRPVSLLLFADVAIYQNRVIGKKHSHHF